MSDDTRYNVIFRGQLRSGVTPEDARKKLAVLLKQPAEKIARLFSGQAVILAKNVDQATADRYRASLAKAGVLCILQPLKAPPKAAPQRPPPPRPLARPKPAVEPLLPDFVPGENSGGMRAQLQTLRKILIGIGLFGGLLALSLLFLPGFFQEAKSTRPPPPPVAQPAPAEDGQEAPGFSLSLEKNIEESAAVRELLFTPDDSLLIARTDKGVVFRYPQNGGIERELPAQAGEVEALALASQARLLASGNRGGEVHLWDVLRGDLQATLHTPELPAIRALALSPGGDTVAAASGTEKLALWSARSGELLALLDAPGNIEKLAFSADLRHLAGAGAEQIMVWELSPDRLAYSLDNTATLALAFSPDGSWLAAAGEDKLIRLWRTANGELLRTLDHGDSVSALAFHPDGGILASAGQDIRLWDTSTGGLLETLNGHQGTISALVFSHDGTLLASGGMDKMLKLWR
jgi:hypothetical protein